MSVVCARVVVWSEWCVLPSSPSSPELDQQNEKKTNVHSQKKLVVCTVHLSPQGQAPLVFSSLSLKKTMHLSKKNKSMTTRMY